MRFVMAEKLVQHKHCRICEKAMPMSDDISCSEGCEADYQQLMKANKKKNLIMVALIMILLFIMVGSFLSAQ